ncbi:hypothetical protein [Clostridium baratii]|uniref:hypothetical protein n=1 Tax=Clostridium baratii TaxID=1561 RepID=UPI0030CD0A34
MYKTVSQEELIKEIEDLKQENEVLRKQLCESSTWISIREGIIYPHLLRKGMKRCVISRISTPISQIVKEQLGINNLNCINASNYEEAKRITIGILKVLNI